MAALLAAAMALQDESISVDDPQLKQCEKLAFYDTGVDAQYGDKLITLSTCEYSQTNGRLVVAAVRID